MSSGVKNGGGSRGTIFDAAAAVEGGLARLHATIEALMERNAQLEAALQSRVVIEQAKGVLAERFALDVATSFSLLRGAARSNRVRIHDLARAVVESPETPAEIELERATRLRSVPAPARSSR